MVVVDKVFVPIEVCLFSTSLSAFLPQTGVSAQAYAQPMSRWRTRIPVSDVKPHMPEAITSGIAEANNRGLFLKPLNRR
jgi:hypothetical protein